MSDAIIPGENGGFLRGLDSKTLSRLLGVSVRVDRAFSATREVAGWSTVWKRPREQALAIAAGSVYRISCEGDQAELDTALRDAALNGIGVRRNEGFGWIAPNPAWLYHKEPVRAVVSRKTQWPAARGWPDLDLQLDVQRHLVEVASQVATTMKTEPAAKQHLTELAAYARRVEDPKAVGDYLSRLASRENARGWDDVEQHLKDPLQQCGGMEAIRFLLEAAATLAPRGKQ